MAGYPPTDSETSRTIAVVVSAPASDPISPPISAATAEAPAWAGSTC